jgi:hypothetical protein
MTDITKTFRALIKAKQTSINANLNLSKRVKKPEKNSNQFLSQAKIILNDVIKLKCLLIESRGQYLSPSYLLSTSNRVMTDEQRVDFEHKVRNQIKQCRDDLEKLKTSIGQISFSGQRRSHYELVCAYLERDLVQCTKIYSEQNCLRHKRESERKKIGRLDHDEQRILSRLDQSSQQNRSQELLNKAKNSPTTENR